MFPSASMASGFPSAAMSLHMVKALFLSAADPLFFRISASMRRPFCVPLSSSISKPSERSFGSELVAMYLA